MLAEQPDTAAPPAAPDPAPPAVPAVACDDAAPARPAPAGEAGGAGQVGHQLQVALALGQAGVCRVTGAVLPHHLSCRAGGEDTLPSHQHQGGPRITGTWQEVPVANSVSV